MYGVRTGGGRRCGGTYSAGPLPQVGRRRAPRRRVAAAHRGARGRWVPAVCMRGRVLAAAARGEGRRRVRVPGLAPQLPDFLHGLRTVTRSVPEPGAHERAAAWACAMPRAVATFHRAARGVPPAARQRGVTQGVATSAPPAGRASACAALAIARAPPPRRPPPPPPRAPLRAARACAPAAAPASAPP